MVSINTPASGHVGPGPVAGWEWLPYGNAKQLKTVQAAVAIIENKIKEYRPCNDAFRALPGGRNFKDVFTDASVWVSLDRGNVAQRFGATLGKEITISAWALKAGRWTVAATLVHELAHVNGAGGADAAAENTLLRCLLHGLHDPGIIGQLIYPLPGSRLPEQVSSLA